MMKMVGEDVGDEGEVAGFGVRDESGERGRGEGGCDGREGEEGGDDGVGAFADGDAEG